MCLLGADIKIGVKMRFKCFLFSPLPGESGETIQFDEYISNGLVQPPTAKKKNTELKKRTSFDPNLHCWVRAVQFPGCNKHLNNKTQNEVSWLVYPFFWPTKRQTTIPHIENNKHGGIIRDPWISPPFEGITMQMWRQLSGIFPLIVHEIWVRNTFWPRIIASRKCQEHLGRSRNCPRSMSKDFSQVGRFSPKTVEGILWRLKKCL